MKRTQAVMIRLDEAQRSALEAMAAAVEIPASTLAHNAVSAMLRAHAMYGTLLLPMRMVPAAHVRLEPSPALQAALEAALQRKDAAAPAEPASPSGSRQPAGRRCRK